MMLWEVYPWCMLITLAWIIIGIEADKTGLADDLDNSAATYVAVSLVVLLWPLAWVTVAFKFLTEDRDE